MGLDEWNALLQYISIGLLALTFVVGALSIFTGKLLNDRLTERLATVTLRVEEESARRAVAELELAKIQERLAWRDVTPEQSARISAALGKFKGQTLVLDIYSSSEEVGRFGTKLRAAFTAAGIIVQDGFHMGPTPKSGVTVVSGAAHNTFADAIGDALLAAGIVTTLPVEITPDRPEVIPNVFVWPK
jgi:hypothetical protein